VCFLSVTLGQQLKFVEQDNINNVEKKVASDRLQWHASNIHEQKWKHSAKHGSQNDFVEMVHIVYMNHLGKACCFVIIVSCLHLLSNLSYGYFKSVKYNI